MLKVGFFRDYYSTVTPLLILVLGAVFGSMGFFRYYSRNLEAIVLFAQRRENVGESRAKDKRKQQ